MTFPRSRARRRPLARITVGVVAALAFLAGPAGAVQAAPAAPAPSTSFSYTSQAGDSVGEGGSGTFTAPAADIAVQYSSTTRLNLSVSSGDHYWSVALAAGEGDVLRPGIFTDASHDGSGRAPALAVSGDSRNCQDVWGSFTVNQIGFDAGGTIELADISFVQRCGSSTAPALKGTIHLNQRPLSFKAASDPGDTLGAGLTKTYLGSTSVYQFGGTASYASLSVDGLRDHWSVFIHAPGDQKLVAGRTYQTRPLSDDQSAGLNVTGRGPGCNPSNQPNGTLTVRTLVVDASGNLTNFFATFEAHCNGAAAALHGTIHWFA